MPELPINPMHKAHQSPRCLARTRSGTACQSPAVRGKRRCRMHGGTNPGAPRGNQNALKHGLRTAEMQALRQLLQK
ncbi:HGGxSTG domain-containing protein [Sphingomonas sp. LR60]|uniref:HGGxSTG domain-containing protein n=1 Tax=Sphingomonas sp. LR60 TaxID=3050233 RepID=UPI003FA751A6